MARTDFTLHAFGYRDMLGRFAKRTTALAATRRELAREAGRVMVEQLKIHAPRKTGKFAAGLFYRTYEYGDRSETRFYAGGEHSYVLPFLAEGTAAHPIPRGGTAAQQARGYPLRFFWPRGPHGPGIYRYWHVQHPGTAASPFIGRACATAQPRIAALMARSVRQLVWL